MKKGFTCLLLLLTMSFSAAALRLDDIRKNYTLAADNKVICLTMIEQLSASQESSIHLAYLGAFKAMWANHALNPVEKLHTFTKGKKHIDQAAQLAPENIEIIFIRHSVQTKSPAFLGYNDHVAADRLFLSTHLHTTDSVLLKEMIENLLAS